VRFEDFLILGFEGRELVKFSAVAPGLRVALVGDFYSPIYF